MSRLRDLREKIHQPVWDTLVRGIGQSNIPNLFSLFGNANIGNRALTNLQQAGQFSSDATYIVMSLRCVFDFKSLTAASEFGAFGQLPALNAQASGTGARALDLFAMCAYGANFTFVVGSKQMLTAPCWYAPAGGGPSGFSTETASSVVTNGHASQAAILRLGKHIAVAARQNFSVTMEWFPFARLGPGIGGAYAADLNPLEYVNNFDGRKEIQVMIDGLITRDVQ